jgi:NAD(P)-dependent dehydrogenase (short-subunit alcohol dehydrogenase family)
MAVNLRAPYQLTQALAPLLVRGQGDVVFINSSVTRGARSEVAHYGASKYALEGLAESLRDEFNPKGVRVLSVYPGRTASPLQERIHEMEGRPYRPELLMQPEDMAQTVLNAVTLPRTAEITEIRVRPMRKT